MRTLNYDANGRRYTGNSSIDNFILGKPAQKKKEKKNTEENNPTPYVGLNKEGITKNEKLGITVGVFLFSLWVYFVIDKHMEFHINWSNILFYVIAPAVTVLITSCFFACGKDLVKAITMTFYILDLILVPPIFPLVIITALSALTVIVATVVVAAGAIVAIICVLFIEFLMIIL